MRKALKIILWMVLMNMGLLATAQEQVVVPYTLSDRDRMVRMEERLDKLEAKMDARFDGVQNQFLSIQNQFDNIQVQFINLSST